MALVRTIIARCDAKGCIEEVSISPYTTQPFIDLVAYGWSTLHRSGWVDGELIVEQLTICPKHNPEENP